MPEVRRDDDARCTEPELDVPPSEFVETFTATMPGSYRLQYGEPTIREHAAIAWRRREKLVHIERWEDASTDSACLCVVTDDRAGLMAMVTTAIGAHSLDIVGAKVFGRARRWQEDEAVDFFWVRGLPGDEVDARRMASIADTVSSLLRGEIELPSLVPRTTPTVRPVGPCSDVVRFDEHAITDLLIVETDDRPSLLAAITAAVTSEAARIVWSAVITVGTRARDEFRLESESGKRLSPAEKDAIVHAVTVAVAALS
jgi:UTP:GlnB (protein PII) uridylyltransferase